MNHKTRWLVTIFILMILATLACATLSGGNPPAIPEVATTVMETGEQAATEIAQITPEVNIPPVEAEPTKAESGGTTSGGEPGADSINLDDSSLYVQPTGVNTFRTSLVFTFSGQAGDGLAVTGSITGEGAFSIDPPQIRFNFQTSDSAVPGESLEIVQMDNTMYMSGGGLGCFSLPVTDEEIDNPYEEMLDTGSMLTGQAQRIQPDETINDIPVYAYEITTANLDTSDPTTQEIVEITFGRLYLAKEGGYIVGIVLDGRGKNAVLKANDLVGDVHYELNYFGFNQPVDIVPPADCESESGGGVSPTGSYPIPDGATDVVSITGITTFSSDQSVEDLTAFYKNEMVAAGWTMGEEVSIAGLATLTFTKDGKTATITITPDPATGKTQVAIFEG